MGGEGEAGQVALNEGREVNPDDTTSRSRAKGSPTRTLNEGREVNPDDT